jgi:hypothetical protein
MYVIVHEKQETNTTRTTMNIIDTECLSIVDDIFYDCQRKRDEN